MRMSPLNKLVYPAGSASTSMNLHHHLQTASSGSKTALGVTSGTKRPSAKKQKTMTINRSRISSEAHNLIDAAVTRTVKSMSPEPQKAIRPRKVKMPTVVNPETLFMAKNSKNLL